MNSNWTFSPSSLLDCPPDPKWTFLHAYVCERCAISILPPSSDAYDRILDNILKAHAKLKKIRLGQTVTTGIR